MSKKNSKIIVYKNLVFTSHAYHRALQRSIAIHQIFQTINYPKEKIFLKENKYKFLKSINQRHYQIIAKYLSKSKQWLIISVWVRGEEDKLPLSWQVISFPFKLVAKFLLSILKLIKKQLISV
jgi:hypothetical protein